MSTSALERNAEAAGPQTGTEPPRSGDTHVAAAPGEPERNRPVRHLNLKQALLVKEFNTDYGVDPMQVYFDGESAEPSYFGFEALSQLAMQLAPNVKDIAVETVEVNQTTGLVLSRGTVVLSDGRTRSGEAGCIVGDALPSGLSVETIKSALDVSGARALQKALRMVGFDPVRAHEAQKQLGTPAPASAGPRFTPEEEQRNNELAEIHILAEQCGLITVNDKTAYRRQLSVFFPGVDSASQLTAGERAQFIATLRGIKSARSRTDEGVR